jgi:hypothetical protein
MSDASAALPAPLAWVTKRDGRLVPFESDRVSRALFAATESLGRPDAFLARELTDGVLHFLAADAEGVPTTAQVAETVAKVVRELGHPALAQAFVDGRQRLQGDGKVQAGESVVAGAAVGPSLVQLSEWIASGIAPNELVSRAGRRSLSAYSLQKVFARDLASAQEAGLFTLGGLETPLQLDGCVLTPGLLASGSWPSNGRGLAGAVREVRALVGDVLALDGLDLTVDHLPGTAGPRELVAGLLGGLQDTGLRAVVNLNLATPPAWGAELAPGPLFADRCHPPAREEAAARAEAWLEAFRVAGDAKAICIDWHLDDWSFAPQQLARLQRVTRLAADGVPLTFVFDRARRPIALAEGLSRSHPAVLLQVALHLPRLRELMDQTADVALFLKKLGSLARLALTAAVQKRAFLRRHGPAALHRGFLVDRARLVIVPTGVGETVQSLLPANADAEQAMALAGHIAQHLNDVLLREGAACRLGTCLELGEDCGVSLSEPRPCAEDLVSLLRKAWQQTDVVRFRPVTTSQSRVSELPFT